MESYMFGISKSSAVLVKSWKESEVVYGMNCHFFLFLVGYIQHIGGQGRILQKFWDLTGVYSQKEWVFLFAPLTP